MILLALPRTHCSFSLYERPKWTKENKNESTWCCLRYILASHIQSADNRWAQRKPDQFFWSESIFKSTHILATLQKCCTVSMCTVIVHASSDHRCRRATKRTNHNSKGASFSTSIYVNKTNLFFAGDCLKAWHRYRRSHKHKLLLVVCCLIRNECDQGNQAKKWKITAGIRKWCVFYLFFICFLFQWVSP